MEPAGWAQLGVGVAACLALVYVARTLLKVVQTQANVADKVVETVMLISADNQKFLTNHMSGITKVLAELMEQAALMNERVDRLHDDNIETARLLARTPLRKPRNQ